MKKYVHGSLGILMLLLFLAGCQQAELQTASEESSVTEDQSLLTEEAPLERPVSEKDVMIKTEKSEYPTTVENITIVLTNEGTEEYSTGLDVFLEKEVEDKWFRVPMKEEFFTEPATSLAPGDTTEMVFNIEDLSYDLTPGEYRATLNGLGAPFTIIDYKKK
ncbi:immunoglobulin-like domain-containing protein [Planococcus kocurii]|uniref:immunoglobulin-like domain-containing protein n=1 Tax=Planococcus kocurii TaxID=1374 RepID=UPI003D090756